MSKNDNIKAIYVKINERLKADFKSKCALDRISQQDKLKELIQKYVGKK